MQDRLFITGCDSNTEWQLEWFVNNFRRHNPDEELMVFDFGMETSLFPEMRKSHRGEEKGWFKKPSAMITASAFAKQVCWLDTDIEVRAPLAGIFDYVQPNKLAMAKDGPWVERRGGPWYNSGVVAFQNTPDILRKWAEHVKHGTNGVMGDQDVLYTLLSMSPLNPMIHINDLPNKYNVLRLQIQDNTLPDDIACMHWTGSKGNDYIKREIYYDKLRKRHKWEYCDHCEREVVICGKCGNNTCNGGHGTVDGKECDECEEAYRVYFEGNKE